MVVMVNYLDTKLQSFQDLQQSESVCLREGGLEVFPCVTASDTSMSHKVNGQ